MRVSLGLLLTAWAGPAAGWQTPSPIDAVRDATVMIETLGPAGRASGTGFIVDDSGTIATAAHVVHGAWMVRIRWNDGATSPVLGILELDRRLDLALIAVAGGGRRGFARPVAFGDSDAIRVGQRLLAMGCPLGLEVSVADGLLSAVQARDGMRLLQISIPVSPGSSGGPVFTEDGRVVGLVVSGMRGNGAENINFALPSNYVTERLARARSLPLAEIGSAAAGVEPVSLSLPPAGSAGPVRLVNRQLAVDYSLVDGLEVATRWKRADGAEFTSLFKVGLSLAPDGAVVVERLRETDVRLHGLIGREVHRTLYQVGPANRFSTSVDFTPEAGRARPYASVLEARGTRYVLSETSGKDRSGQAPNGILPPALADVALAASPEPIGDRVEFLVLDPHNERLVRARFEFTGRERRRLPIVQHGGSCGPGAKTRLVAMDVLVGVREEGLDRKPIAVLAAPPYVLLEGQVQCLRLPDPRSRLASSR